MIEPGKTKLIHPAEWKQCIETLRARLQFRRRLAGEDTFKLTGDISWSQKYFTPGNPAMKARQAMAGTSS